MKGGQASEIESVREEREEGGGGVAIRGHEKVFDVFKSLFNVRSKSQARWERIFHS